MTNQCFLALAMAFAWMFSALDAQLLSLPNGSGVVIDGRAVTVRHVLVPNVSQANDGCVDIGPGVETFRSGEARIGPAVMAGVVRGRVITETGHVIRVRPLLFRPRPRRGMSGGPIIQSGRCVGLIRARDRVNGWGVPVERCPGVNDGD